MKLIVPEEFANVDPDTKQAALDLAVAMEAAGLTRVDHDLFVVHLDTLLAAAGTTIAITSGTPGAVRRAAQADLDVCKAVADVAIDNYHAAVAVVDAYDRTDQLGLFGGSLSGIRWVGHPDQTATATVDGCRYRFDVDTKLFQLLVSCPTSPEDDHTTVIRSKADLAAALETPESVRWACEQGRCPITGTEPAEHPEPTDEPEPAAA